MSDHKNPLDIIAAIEAASDEQLAALARIETALTHAPSSTPAPAQTNVQSSEITVQVQRRGRASVEQAAKANPVIKSDTVPDNVRRAVEDVREKMLSPMREKREQQNERLRDARGRYVSADSVGKLIPAGTANIRMNDRVFQQDNLTGRQRFTDKALNSNVIDLKSAIRSLDKTVTQHDKDVVRIDKAGRMRDGNGRFLSKDKARELQQRKQDGLTVSEAKAREGFMTRLGGALSSYGEAKGDGEAGDVAGTAAGGVLWHMGRGAFDVGKSAYDTAATLNEFRKNAFAKPDVPADEKSRAGNEETTRGNLALKPAIAYPEVKPLAADASQKTFQQNISEGEKKATLAQTETLSRKDDLIIKNQEDEIELLRKIARKESANDSLGRGLFSKLFGRRGRRGRSGSRERFRDRFRKSRDVPHGEEKTKKTGEKPEPHGEEKKSRKPPASEPETGKSHGKTTTETKEEKTPQKGAAKTAENSGTRPDAKTGKADSVKTGGKTAIVTEKEATSKLSHPTVPKNLTSEAANDALRIGEKTGIGAMAKGAGTLLRGLPVVGQVLAAGIDASNGYSDKDGQKEAFNLKEGQEATTRQKTEMSAANVATMGGLIPLASQGLSWVADKAGMEKAAKALDFDTSDVARGMDHGVTKAGQVGTSIKNFFTGNHSEAPAGTLPPDSAAKVLQDSINEGADKTVSAINKLAKQLEGGKYGEDGVGTEGKAVSDYKAPLSDNFSMGPNGLNIGGSHAKNRNFRNNNFGNLNFAGQDGAVLENAPANGKARFARFNTPEEGMRALANQVSSYAHGTSKAAGYQKLDTVDKIISKWAPKGENDTDKYIQSVAGSLGVKPTDTINTDDPEIMTRLIRSISTYEGGNPTVSDKTIRESIGNYDDRSGKWKGGKFSKATQDYLDQQAAKNGTPKIANNALVSVGKNATTIATHIAPKNIPPGINQESTPTDSAKKSLSASIYSQYGKVNIPSGINPEWEQIASHMGLKGALEKAQGKARSSDVAIVDYLEKKTGQHLKFRRPDSGLTLPGGSQPVPDGLKAAMSLPGQMSPNAPGNENLPSADLPKSVRDTPGASPAQVNSNPPGLINPPGMVYSENGLISAARITPATANDQGSGIWSRTKGIFGDMADSVTKDTPKVLSSVGNAVLPIAKSALSGVAGGLGSSLSGTIKNPFLSSVAEPFISQGVNAANGAINSLSLPNAQPLLSIPKAMPAITDLSQSDSAASVQQPKSRTSDDVLAKSLQQLIDLTKKLVSNQRDDGKSESRPDVVVHGGQKKPKRDDHFNDSALDALMEDD